MLMADDAVEAPFVLARVEIDYTGLGLLLGGVPPDLGAGEVVGDPLVVVDRDLDVLAIIA